MDIDHMHDRRTRYGVPGDRNISELQGIGMEYPHPIAQILRLTPIVEVGDNILTADEE